jgi:hypothetical protein
MASDVIRGSRLTGSPVAFFLAMLAIITLQVSGSVTPTQQYWTFIPHLLLLQAATWEGPNILTYTNDSELMGGHCNWHMIPTSVPIISQGIPLWCYYA